jgi:hypothetical protein
MECPPVPPKHLCSVACSAWLLVRLAIIIASLCAGGWLERRWTKRPHETS